MTIRFKVKPPSNFNKLFDRFKAKKVSQAVKSSIKAGHDQFIDEVRDGFTQQKTPGGDAWQKLSPGYAAYKQAVKPGKGILEFEGDMKKAALGSKLDWSDGGNATDSPHLVVSMAVDDPKAYKHEFGDSATKLPARPFFKVLGDARKAVLEKAFGAFDKQIKK